jgi:hypothetical protein
VNADFQLFLPARQLSPIPISKFPAVYERTGQYIQISWIYDAEQMKE